MKCHGASARALLVLSFVLCSSACGGSREVILRTAGGAEVTATEIDREPLWLLPPGGVGWLHLEMEPAARSELGKYVLADLRSRFPLPESSGLSLERDVARFTVATYSMQGVDVVGVATGRFDAERIASAAAEYRGGALSPQLVKSTYAGRTLFLAQSVGFAIITPQTAIFGNEVGIRRSLERITESRVADDVPAWAKELLATPNATFSVGVDLAASAVTSALPGRLAPLRGASMARAVGNFDDPGINLAGTISHADHEGARGSAAGLLQVGGSVNIYGRLLGLGQPLRKLETQAVGNDTQVVLAVDGAAVIILMKRFLPPPPAPHTGPGWAHEAPVLAPALTWRTIP